MHIYIRICRYMYIYILKAYTYINMAITKIYIDR